MESKIWEWWQASLEWEVLQWCLNLRKLKPRQLSEDNSVSSPCLLTLFSNSLCHLITRFQCGTRTIKWWWEEFLKWECLQAPSWWWASMVSWWDLMEVCHHHICMECRHHLISSTCNLIPWWCQEWCSLVLTICPFVSVSLSKSMDQMERWLPGRHKWTSTSLTEIRRWLKNFSVLNSFLPKAKLKTASLCLLLSTSREGWWFSRPTLNPPCSEIERWSMNITQKSLCFVESSHYSSSYKSISHQVWRLRTLSLAVHYTQEKRPDESPL